MHIVNTFVNIIVDKFIYMIYYRDSQPNGTNKNTTCPSTDYPHLPKLNSHIWLVTNLASGQAKREASY